MWNRTRLSWWRTDGKATPGGARSWRGTPGGVAGGFRWERAFARREEINFHTFIGWLQRQRCTGGGRAPAVRFQEVSVTAAPKSVAALEVVLPGGWIMRGQEIAAVAELVRALRS